MKRNGFTLIELVMILALIVIVAVVVAPKLGDVTATNAGAFLDKLRADIRYAQDLSMTRNRRARVYFNGTGTAPAAGYAVVQDNSATGNCSSFVAASDPSLSGNLTITLNVGQYAGITVVPFSGCLEYGSFGEPYDCGANLGICSVSPAAETITINPGGQVVTVTIQTGAVN